MQQLSPVSQLHVQELLPELEEYAASPIVPVSIHDETRTAAKNGVMLGASLAFTASIGVFISLFIVPRVVGTDGTGVLGFGEALATVGLVVAGLGMDSYLRKEVATDKNHANRFFMSIVYLRFLLSVALTIAAVSIAVLRQNEVQQSGGTQTKSMGSIIAVVLLFCGAQFFQQTSESYAAVLQAVGEVKHQSRLAIITKSLWALILIVGLSLRVGIWVVPLALLFTEAAKAVVLGISAQRIFHFDWKLRLHETWPVARAGTPFLVTAIAVKLIAWGDVTLVKLLTGSDAETGYYTIAMRISSLALLLAPLIQWVVTPLAARSSQRSLHEFSRLTRGSLQWVIVAGVPLSLLLGLNADEVINAMQLKAQFGPAIWPLRILSAVIALAYVSILGGTLLIASGHSWRVVRITFVTIAVDVFLNLILIRRGLHWFGSGSQYWKPGGAGVGASISLVAAEATGVALYMWELRKITHTLTDADSRKNLVSLAGVCAFVIAIDRLLVHRGIARPIVDLFVTIVGLTLSGVVRLSWYQLAWRFVQNRLPNMLQPTKRKNTHT